MALLSVRCNHCGAPIEVGESTRFATCQFCNSQLQVTQTASSAYTEVVQQIAEQNTRMMGNLRVIEVQNELERLDREWGEERCHYYIKGKDGHKHRPSTLGGIIGFVIAAVAAVIAISHAIDGEKSATYAIISGSVAVLLGLFSTYLLYSAHAFNKAEIIYLDRRDFLLQELGNARDESSQVCSSAE